jgi:outer membrane immunogenic protein
MRSNVTRNFAMTGAALMAMTVAGSAFAADLAPVYKAPAKAVAPAPTWTGFYIGGNIGYGWDTHSPRFGASTDDPFFAQPLADLLAAGSYPASLSPDAQGIIGGAQIGYNWRLSSPWLIGLEADIQGSGIKGSDTRTLSPLFFDVTTTSVTKSIDWFGTVRGRIGFLANPQWLLYATGGLAYGETKLSFNSVDVSQGCNIFTLCGAGSSSGVRAGWTAGGGVEAMLAQNWSAKVEYLYIDLGGRSMSVPTSTIPAINFNSSTDFREHIVRAGVNYHFNWGGPVSAR